jgi:magnesium chelatase family protein
VARTHAIAVTGVRGYPVEIEASIENGPAGLLLHGLPDTAASETRDRIRAAVINSGHAWPQCRITVSLSPASLPKRGTSFDLGIAVAILAATGSVRAGALTGTAFIAELGLDGRIRPVPGVLPAVTAAAAAGFARVITSPPGLPEAALVPGVQVAAPATLAALTGWLNSGAPTGDAAVQIAGPAAWHPAGPAGQHGTSLAGLAAGSWPTAGPRRDLADLRVSPAGRQAAEVCAAGGHHLLLTGPPGSGKTMLAQRIPALMPPLQPAHALEATAIHSVAGNLAAGQPLITQPPFIAPHHTATRAAIVGGGNGVIRPGAASLAHMGCLFMNEAPEFARDVLDALRQPLESGEITIARSGLTAVFPARFTLILAANPCPCARFSGAGTACTCPPAARNRYLARLSGPLLDRVDVRVELLPAARAELLRDRHLAETSAVAAGRVALARERSDRRLNGTRWRLNAEVPGAELRRSFRPSPGALGPLERALDLGEISARGVDRVIALAWTLADLAGSARPGLAEVRHALDLRLGASQ